MRSAGRMHAVPEHVLVGIAHDGRAVEAGLGGIGKTE